MWAAFTTKEGQESWNVAHAEIELKIGGKMRTHYDAKGQIGDPNTIENNILSFEPKRMLSIQVTNPPEKFPFKDAVKNMWTVIYFADAGPGRTRLRIVGLGFGTDEDSQKLRGFFDKGNAYTLKKLQEKFAGKGGKNAPQVDPSGPAPPPHGANGTVGTALEQLRDHFNGGSVGGLADGKLMSRSNRGFLFFSSPCSKIARQVTLE